MAIRPNKRTLVFNKLLGQFIPPEEDIALQAPQREKQAIARDKAMLDADDDEPHDPAEEAQEK